MAKLFETAVEPRPKACGLRFQRRSADEATLKRKSNLRKILFKALLQD